MPRHETLALQGLAYFTLVRPEVRVPGGHVASFFGGLVAGLAIDGLFRGEVEV